MRRTVPCLTALLLLAALPAGAQEPTHHEGLGSLAFPTSSDVAEARRAFERGTLLLHSFEYDDARDAFRRAQELDPGFAMAYWGEAMTHNHPVWNQRDAEAAREALGRYAPSPEARAARAPTERERAWLEAVDVLYAEGGPKAARDTLYARAMEALAERWPEDDEAKAFHALALLGLSQGQRDVPGYMQAGAIALDVFERNPDHPGAAHYVIHSFDDPTHAPLGLEAARAYAGIAPDAAHAQHMTTHIFLALGMWEGVVAQNEQADAVVDRQLAERGEPATDCGHYNEWLSYGYAQQGRDADAEALVLGCMEEAAEWPRDLASAALMRALYVAATEDLDGPVVRTELEAVRAMESVQPSVLAVRDWASGYAAARRGDVDEARRRLRALEELLDGGPAMIPYWAAYPPVWLGTLRSVVAAAGGDMDRAVEEAREAAEREAALPIDFGPPVSFKPPRELEGEMLLEAGRAEEALVAFRTALGRTPRRARTLAGYALAAEAAGQAALAERVREELEEVRETGRRDR